MTDTEQYSTNLITKYAQLWDEAKRLQTATAEHLEELKKVTQLAESRLIGVLEDADMDGVTVHGARYEIQDNTSLYIPKGDSDHVNEWISENGGEDLVKPSIHHKTRNSFLEKLFFINGELVGVPEELSGKISIFTKINIKKSKA